MIRWFNEWFEDRLAVAIGLAADMRAVVGDREPSPFGRAATDAEVAAIGQFLAEQGLKVRTATIHPFPVANDTHSDTQPEPPRPAA